jgi:hypothetical protein
MLHAKALLFIAILAILSQKAAADGGKKDGKKNKDKYVNGFYYDQTGHKINGLISKDELVWQSFNFKKSLGDTAVKIEADQCDSFTVGNRTYRSISGIQIKGIVWRNNSDRAFAELLADGPVQLYSIQFEPANQGYMKAISIASNFTGGFAGQVVGNVASRRRVNYFLRHREAGAYLRVEKDSFKEDMTSYFKDDATLTGKLGTNQDYTINNIEPIVREYNSDYIAAHLNNLPCAY